MSENPIHHKEGEKTEKMKDQYRVVYGSPTLVEYKIIRREGGLDEKSDEAIRIGLKNSLFAISIYDKEQLIGMGRITGDGAASFQIVDIVVKQNYRRQGVAKRIMAELTHYLDHNTYPGSYVSLIADEPANKIYAQFGFNYTIATSHGMIKKY